MKMDLDRLAVEYRERMAEEDRRRARLWWNERAPAKYRSMMRDAADRGIMVGLTEGQYAILIADMECSYCGGELDHNGASLDRMDPWEGYTWDNCVPCCSRCNTAKGELTAEQFERVIGPAVASHGRGNVWPPRNERPDRQERQSRKVEAKAALALSRALYQLSRRLTPPPKRKSRAMPERPSVQRRPRGTWTWRGKERPI